MKWLLITTIKKNPGDEFIRVGIQKLITEIDNDPRFILVDKETTDMDTILNFDKSVWCGMPLFWSLNENKNHNIKWWKYLVGGWPSIRKNNFCVLGGGSFQDWESVERNADINGLIKSAKDLCRHSYLVTVRDPIVNLMCKTNFEVIVCPAIFSTHGIKKINSIKGCNLMPNGGHYSIFNPKQSLIWQEKVKLISDILLKNDFKFFAHNEEENQFAINMGWKRVNIINYNKNVNDFLNSYRNVDQYFGNRVHGCIVSRGNNANVISCGYDSRQEAVKLTKAKTILPSELNLSKLETWAKYYKPGKNINLPLIKRRYLKIIKEFGFN